MVRPEPQGVQVEGAATPRVGFHVSAWGSDHVLAALSGVSKFGFHGLEIYADTTQIFADRPDEFRSLVEIVGVSLAGVHGGGVLTSPEFHDGEVAEWTRLLDWVRDAGGEYAIYYGGDATGDPDADLEHAARLLDAVGSAAAERGVTFCYEADRGCPFDSREGIAALMARTNPAFVRLSADTAHLVEMGVDPSLFLLTQKGRLGVVHVRDIRRPDDTSVSGDAYVDPGRGAVDLHAVNDTLRTIGFEGWLVGVVDRPTSAAIHSVEATARYFREELGLDF